MSNYKDLSSEELKRTLAEKQDILRRTMKPDEYKKFMQELDDCQIKIDYSKFGKPVQYPETQEWCSKLVGTYDKKKVSSNYNADILGVGKGQGTSSSTEEKRIIKPEEFAYLKDVVCVFPNGYKRLQKANYYEDKTFTDRM